MAGSTLFKGLACGSERHLWPGYNYPGLPSSAGFCYHRPWLGPGGGHMKSTIDQTGRASRITPVPVASSYCIFSTFTSYT